MSHLNHDPIVRQSSVQLQGSGQSGMQGQADSGPVRESPISEGALILAIILVSVALRPGIVSIGPVLPSIIGTFGLTHAQASLLTTIPDLLMGLLALPTPSLAKRFGRNAVLLAALLLLTLSMVVRAFAPNVLMLLLSTAGVGAGIAVAGALFAGLIKTRFPTRVATLMGIYATALSFGSVVSAGLTGAVAIHSSYGWRLGVGVWSIVGCVAVAAWLAVMRAERKSAEPSRVPVTASRLPIGIKTAWLVALFFACVNFLFYALLSWTAPMYQEQGASPEHAGLILASFTAAFMCANPVFGALSKSHDRRAWLALCAMLSGAGVLGLAFAPTALPFLWVPLAAIGLGGGFTLGMTLPLDNTHSADEANTWNAFVLTVGYLIAAAGPLLMGALRDATGGFRVPVAMLVAVCALMLLLSPFLAPREHAHVM